MKPSGRDLRSMELVIKLAEEALDAVPDREGKAWLESLDDVKAGVSYEALLNLRHFIAHLKES